MDMVIVEKTLEQPPQFEIVTKETTLTPAPLP